MLKKISKVLLYLIFFYAVIGFLILPFMLKPQIVKVIEESTNTKADVASLYINPFDFVIQASNVDIKLKDSSKLFSLKKLVINLDPSSLMIGSVHVKSVILDNAELFVRLDQNSSLNLLKALKPSSAQQKPQKKSSEFKLPRIVIDHVNVNESAIEYQDDTKAKSLHLVLDDIGFALKDIDTKDMSASDTNLRVHTLLSDGSLVDIKSKILSLQPLRLKGNLSLENIQLYTLWNYFQEEFKIEVADGRVNMKSDFYIDTLDMNKTAFENASVDLQTLRIKPKESYDDILLLESASINDADIKLADNKIKVSKIALDRLHVEAFVDKKGTLDLTNYFRVENSRSSENNSTAPWHLSIDTIAFNKVSMNLLDESITPSVKTTLNELSFQVNDLALNEEKQFNYELFLRANDAFTCKAKGEGSVDSLETNSTLTCKGFDFVHYKPYITAMTQKNFKRFNLDLKSASLGFDGGIATDKDSLQVNNFNINLDDFALVKKSTKEELLGFENLLVRGIDLDTREQTLDVGYGVINTLHVDVKKYKNGAMNIDNLVLAKKQKNETASKPYHVTLKHVAVKSSKINFDDKSISPSAKQRIDRIEFNGYNIDSNKYSWMDYDLYARLNARGIIRSKAKLRLSPLKQKGDIKLSNIELKSINPYLNEQTFINISKGSFAISAKSSYEASTKKADLHINGSLELNNLNLNDSRDDFEFASLDRLKVNKFIFELSPDSLYVDEVSADKLALHGVVKKDKHFNLSTLVKVNEGAKNDSTKSEFQVRIDKIALGESVSTFDDLSLSTPFEMQMQKMTGVVYNFSNILGYTTYANLSTELPKSGFIHFEGSLDTSNPKVYTLLDVKLQNLDLHSLSPYSYGATGYELDNGKLYISSNYDIANSKLYGKNNIVINNIELGKINPDKNATHLPLGLAVGLLEDSRGVIDFNMPIEGDIGSPDFKYGGLVIKTFTKLIFSAVASPFALLGKILDVDTDKLSGIHFAFGSYELSESEKKKLDTIATIMTTKPKISLSVTGVYDTKLDLADEDKIEVKKLEALATKRVTAIKDYLIKEKAIDATRVLNNGVSFAKVPKEEGVESKIEIILSVL